jgi:hypothetical protein
VHIAAVSALAIASTLGLRLGETGELSLDEGQELVGELARAIEASGSGRAAAVDDPVWAGACAEERCVAEVRARTHADEVLVVRAFAGLTMIRVTVERHVSGRAEASRVEADVPRKAEDRGPAMARLVASIFGTGGGANASPQPSLPQLTKAEAEPARAVSAGPLPWVILAGSAAVLGAGIVFGLSSRSARRDSESPSISDADFNRLADRAQVHAVVADVFYLLAAVGAAAGVVLLVKE